MATSIINAGTVTLAASATVTGSGTNWLAAGVRAGDQFFHDGLVALIASVESDTSLTLSRAWPGATGAGLEYDIALLEAQTRTGENNSRLRELMEEYQKQGSTYSAAEINAGDYSAIEYFFEPALEAFFYLDASSTEADDGGVTTIVDSEGNRFTRLTTGGTGDVTAANNFGTDGVMIRSDGTGKGVKASVIKESADGKIGIGTDPMSYEFELKDDVASSVDLAVSNPNAGGSVALRLLAGLKSFFFQTYASGITYAGVLGGAFVIGTYNAFSYSMQTNGLVRFVINSDGRITIGGASASAMVAVAGGVRVGNYTKATLPSAATNGSGTHVYVTDEAAGYRVVVSDGTDWIRVRDGAVVTP